MNKLNNFERNKMLLAREYYKFYIQAFEDRKADKYYKFGNDEVAIIYDNIRVIFVFEGSKGFLDWFSNFRFKFKTIKKCIEVHNGINKSALKFYSLIIKIINENKKLIPIFLGYSRGAGIALLLSYYMSQFCRPICITYGQLKIFEENDCRAIEKEDKFDYYRVYFKSDPVSKVPLELQDYDHIKGNNIILKEKWYHKIPLFTFKIKCHLYYKEVLS